MALNKEELKKFLQATPIRDVMAFPVITVKEDDDFALVHERFSLYSIRHIAVVNDAGVIVGLISQRDLYKIHSPRKLQDGSWYYDKELLNQFILKNVMHKDIFTLKPHQSLYEAMDAMVRFKFGSIPIVDDYNIPCGMMTRVNVLKFLI